MLGLGHLKRLCLAHKFLIALLLLAAVATVAVREISRDRIPTIEGLASDDVLEIGESTFRYMFSELGFGDLRVDRRFILMMGSAPAELLDRFQSETIPVRSPHVWDPKYAPDTWECGSYNPSGGSALFYYISSITRDGDSRVKVECFVVWDELASRGFTVTLEKHDGKWAVTKDEGFWLE